MRPLPTVAVTTLTAVLLSACGQSPSADTGRSLSELQRYEAQRAKRLTPRNHRRARQVMRAYRTSGGASRWLIKSVTVDDASITVHTDLFPKPSNEPPFRGVCSSIMDLYAWVGSIEVESADGVAHALWSDGDRFCNIVGL